MKVMPILLITILASVIAGVIVSGQLFGVNLLNLAVIGGSFSFTAAGDYAFDTDIPWLQSNGGDFLLGLGDLGYSSDEAGWCSYIRGINHPFLWVTGNHDTNEDGPGDFPSYQTQCPVPSGFTINGVWGERYYFDYPTSSPTTRFIGIAAGVGGSQVDGNYAQGTTNYSWLSSTIDQAKSLNYWTVVFYHKPCITVGSKSCDEFGNGTGQDVWNLLLAKRVDLVLNGHDHNYQRSHQLTCGPTGQTQSSCIIDSDNTHNAGAGTVLVVDGNAGQCCYSVSGSDSEAGYFASYNSGGNIISKYSVTSSGVSQSASGVNGHSFSDAFTIGTTGGPSQLNSDFTFSPNNPIEGDTVTYTAVVSGGTAPYTYLWSFGATTQIATQTYSLAGAYPVSLSVSDTGGQTDSVPTKQVIVAPAGGNGNPPPVPVMIGWGGMMIDEVSILGNGGLSLVFPGEPASNLELEVLREKSLGYNIFRLSFGNPCTTNPVFQGGAPAYNSAQLEKAFRIAETLDMWIIVDYHGYDDIATDVGRQCWLDFWSPIVDQFKNRYVKLVWEPLNEPVLFSDTDVPRLSTTYQDWIIQTRNKGDTSWIVVQNLCSYACGFSNMADGYPTVTDSLGKVLISLHSYMGFPYVTPWTLAKAEEIAQGYYSAVVTGMFRTGWGALNTEGSADELCDLCAPDEVLTGSAGYTTTTFHMIKTLTELYDAHLPQRINWVWWTAGSWTDTPGAGLYGSLSDGGGNVQLKGWGILLYEQVPPGPIGGGSYNYLTLIPWIGVAGAGIIGGIVLSRRRK